ncbi:MAG: reductive dehalogenase [Dehalogenimonas sp.]|uniref:Reductive dehalogenase n=1 Tax=Candidatus Dehalogenimonas loeffleri TaxID=3127115 RepID=A0ABZ2J2N9_9CHLR|nr:reductive dehalogenase [Dehalogenimonas sp.]
MGNKFHSTLSRRDFMKGLGIAGAGIGAAAAVAPSFSDLDELTTSGSNSARHPWWVKENELEHITSEVDWKLFTQYDSSANPVPNPSAENAAWRKERDAKFDSDGLVQKIPGRDVRCAALADMVTGLQPAAPWDGPAGVAQPQDKGAARWEGSAEDNTNMLRAALHLASANQVGAMELNDHMLQIFTKGAVVFDSSEKGYQEGKVYHIPSKCKYLLTYSVQQNYIQGLYQLREDEAYPGKLAMPMPLGRPAIHRAYGDGRYTEWQAMRFIKALGYHAYKAGVTTNVALGIFSGLGEQGRATYMMTPRSGLQTRITNYIITDLPLAPTNPIDFGGSKFCETCMRCAEKCPSEALGQQKEPTWDMGPGNRPGYRGWRVDWLKCKETGAPSRCGVCHTLCPFNHPNEGLVHPMVRAVSATTPIFDGFFASMDRIFQYAEPKSPEELEAWWTRDLENWKPDVTHGAGTFQW